MAKQKEAWDKLSMQEKAQLIKLSVDNGVSSLKQIRDTYNLYSNGGDLGAYNTFVETLPDNMKHTDTAKYDMYRYWKLNGRPKDFEEAKKRKMFLKESDGYYHASTLAEVTNSPDKHYGTLEFIKAKNHNTIGLEVGAYLKDKNHPMRNREYILDYTEDKARYRPRTYAESILPEGAYVGTIPVTAQYATGGNLAHKYDGKQVGQSWQLNNGYNSSEDWQLQMKMKTNQMLQNLENSPFYMTDQEMQNLELSRMEEAMNNNPSSEIVTYVGFDNNGNEITKILPVAKGLNTMMDAGVVDYMPILGDAKQVAEAGAAALQGDYLTAGLLGGMMFVPNFIEKPFKVFRKYRTLPKHYRNIDSVKQLWNSDLDLIDQIQSNKFMPWDTQTLMGKSKQELQTLNRGLNLFKQELNVKDNMFYPQSYGQYTPITMDPFEKTVKAIKQIKNNYQTKKGTIKQYNQILFDITEDSPEYLNQIYDDLISGKINNIENYVRDLVIQDNTFSRNMSVNYGWDKIQGHFINGNPDNYYLNLGAGNTGRYGDYGAVYQIKPLLLGDVSTWWKQRKVELPEPLKMTTGHLQSGHNADIKDLYIDESTNDIALSVVRYLNMEDILPKGYINGGTGAHAVIESPVKGATIAPYFNIIPVQAGTSYADLPIRFSLRYSNGGKLNHIINQKSTGGPLYPFSFEKNPFLKTPIVRYDEGGKKQDDSNPGGYTDEQLNKNYQIWKTYDPTGGLNFINYLMSQGFGNLARGEENEYWKEYLGLDSAVPLMNSNAHTEWDKQIEAQKKQNGKLASDFYGTTPRMDYNIQALADTLMLGNMVRNYEEYDKKYNLPHIETVTEAYEQAKNILNNPNKWTQVDGEIEVNNWPFNPNISESNPLGMLANFGMKWVPEENALYMHDTYDFPSRVHKKTEIPVRPREMKIRSKISFDPTKGSWLLRSPVNYNTEIPAKVTK